jgi:hypothetical protein
LNKHLVKKKCAFAGGESFKLLSTFSSLYIYLLTLLNFTLKFQHPKIFVLPRKFPDTQQKMSFLSFINHFQKETFFTVEVIKGQQVISLKAEGLCEKKSTLYGLTYSHRVSINREVKAIEIS